MKILTIIAMMMTTQSAIAKTDYCNDPKVDKEWKQHIKTNPKDTIIIKLAGLREGLCRMINRGEITHDVGNEIWHEEHQKDIIKRQVEEFEEKPERGA